MPDARPSPPAAPLRAVVPAAFSVLRLVVAAAFPFVAPGMRLALVIIAAASDAVDGFIARRLGATSVAGALLDAIIDKLFALTVLVTLAAGGAVPWWQLPPALARDLVVAGIALNAALRRRWDAFARMRPHGAGKLTTFLQFSWFIALVLPAPAWACHGLFALVAATSLWAAFDYLRRCLAAT